MLSLFFRFISVVMIKKYNSCSASHKDIFKIKSPFLLSDVKIYGYELKLGDICCLSFSMNVRGCIVHSQSCFYLACKYMSVNN